MFTPVTERDVTTPANTTTAGPTATATTTASAPNDRPPFKELEAYGLTANTWDGFAHQVATLTHAQARHAQRALVGDGPAVAQATSC